MPFDGLFDPTRPFVPAPRDAAAAARAAEAALTRALPPGARWTADLGADPMLAAHHEAFRTAHAEAVFRAADDAEDAGEPWELEDDGSPWD